MYKKIVILSLISLIFNACVEKDFDPTDSEKSYIIAKEPYDEGNFEIALNKLAEFKARYPYSKYAAQTELLIANSHFELERFTEAAYEYTQFVKLHPKNIKIDFALYRVGASFWADAPDEIDREQEYTSRALKEWAKLVERFPASQYTKMAKEKIEIGKKRVADSQMFVADFYCKQKIWHACAHRNLAIADKFKEFKAIQITAARSAARALKKLALIKKQDPSNDSNLYFRSMSAEEILKKSQNLMMKVKAAQLTK